MKDGDLWVNVLDDDCDRYSYRLYPIGEDEFGRKGGMVKLKFGDGCVTYIDFTCKKLDETDKKND